MLTKKYFTAYIMLIITGSGFAQSDKSSKNKQQGVDTLEEFSVMEQKDRKSATCNHL